MLQQKCFIILVPYDRNEGSCDDPDEERRVKTEKENVTERCVRDADATDDDGRRQNDAADHRRHRREVEGVAACRAPAIVNVFHTRRSPTSSQRS